MKKRLKIFTVFTCAAAVILACLLSLYLWILPAAVSSNKVKNMIVRKVEKFCGAELVINEPVLVTGLNSNIGFKLNEISLTKDEREILSLKNLETEISFSQLFAKRLIIKKLLAEKIYMNISDLMALFPEEEQKKENKESDFSIDIFSAVLGVKECLITYNNSDIGIEFDAHKVLLDRTRSGLPGQQTSDSDKPAYYLHFDFDFTLVKGDDKIEISADDGNRIYMGGGELHVDKFPIVIDESEIIINAFASRKQGVELNVSSQDFNARDIYDIVSSNIILPNGKELLAPICDVTGSIDFNLNLTKKNIRGDVNVNESEFKIKDLLNMPVKITQGIIDIGNTEISLKDFKGYYNNKEENSMVMSGEIKDYWKTCDTKIVSDIFVNDDFFQNYVTVLLGAPVSLVGDAGSRLTLTSKNGSCDIVWYFLLQEGEGFKLGDQSMVLEKYKTLFKLDMSVLGNILKLNTIDYYITNELKKGMTPVLALSGSLDMADNMKLLNINLNIPRPLPSEFLNFLCGQKIFRKGTISGKLSIDNRGEFPKMDGALELSEVRLPAQRMFIKSAKFGAKGDKLEAIASGKFKRSDFDFNGYTVNELRLPIIVKSVNLTVDDIDIEKLLNNAQQNPAVQVESTENLKQALSADNQTDDDENDDVPTFVKGLVVVENCNLNLEKGKYKEIDFGNLHANLTFDKEGVLELQSNKFNIAEGISTLKVKADLIKQDYYLRLGIKDVNSDVMASAVLGLPREISGKAKGLIEITSDKNLKLNGDIKFNIQNGTIEKVGYVEYILKVASLFRNPLAMITPATFGDLVNIPDGTFDEIKGEMKLKDNVIEKMMIKSSAKQLSSFIVGRYNLETNDAILRIYTKMSNKGEGFAGFLRNISLNTLASKISASGRNDSNYYASELEQLPAINAEEKDCQVFLTTVDGDVINFNFLSSLKRIK